MQTRQSKKGEYHSIIVRVPVGLWEKVRAKALASHKSYSGFIVEILRNQVKEQEQSNR